MRSPFSLGSGAYQHELYSPCCGAKRRRMTARSTSVVWSRGCCFVLLDGEGAFADEAGRRFINYLHCNLSNSSARRSFLTNTHASSPLLRACCRSGITARWISAGSPRRLTCVSRLSSAPFSSRNWWSLPEAIRILLERWHIRAEIRIDAFDSFNSHAAPSCGYLAQQLYARYPSVPAFLEWLASTTLFTRLPETQRQNLNALLPTILNSDNEQAFATIAAFFP